MGFFRFDSAWSQPAEPAVMRERKGESFKSEIKFISIINLQWIIWDSTEESEKESEWKRYQEEEKEAHKLNCKNWIVVLKWTRGERFFIRSGKLKICWALIGWVKASLNPLKSDAWEQSDAKCSRVNRVNHNEPRAMSFFGCQNMSFKLPAQ